MRDLSTVDLREELANLLERVSAASSFEAAAETLTSWAKDLTGCEAAMLRLTAGEGAGAGPNAGVGLNAGAGVGADSGAVAGAAISGRWIPALAHNGLDPRFLQEESLVGADECLCGRVSQGQTDPALPFFTDGGSFLWGRAQSLRKNFNLASLGGIRGYCLDEGFDSLGIFPLGGGVSPVGCLHLADHAPDKFSAYREILEQACIYCAPILMRHRTEEREGALIRATEAALLPRDLPEIAGLDLAVSFTSATAVARVGGDFYDVLDLSDGDAGSGDAGGDVLIYVGDYSGNGIEVAGLAARVRHALSTLAREYLIGTSSAGERSAGLADEHSAASHAADLAGAHSAASHAADLAGAHSDLSVFVSLANGLLERVLPREQFVTVAFCRLAEHGALGAALAGHPQPMLLSRDGEAKEIALPANRPLGLPTYAPFAAGDSSVGPSDSLLLYSDGVSESRRGGHFFGVEGIREAWRSGNSLGLSEFARELCLRSERFHDESLPRDDRLVLIARRSRQAS